MPLNTRENEHNADHGGRNLSISGGRERFIWPLPLTRRVVSEVVTETVWDSSDRGVKQSEIKQFTSWLGKRSYKARLERFGLARLQEIARENGKKGGRPKGKLQKKGGK